jgi:membrane associated rhomboid family serine protease
MIQVTLSDTSAVRVDVCRLCHFVWFDSREVETLVPRPLPSAPPPLPQKAREILAIAKVQQLAEEAEGSAFDSAPPDEWWKQIAAFLGMPVEFDTAARERTPWATWILCAVITCASAYAMLTNLHEIVLKYGLIPAQATRLGGLTFLTSFFLHAGIIHLVGNMYFLLVFGDDVENFLRPGRYLLLIALSAFIGDLAHIAADPHSSIPSIGASGGIAGVITFYALQFPRLKLAFLLRYWYHFQWIRLPAWSALVLWILFQVIGAWEQVAGISSVSALAHLGGAAFGFVAWLMWHKASETPDGNEAQIAR